ncbi:EF hand domain conatining, putative [Babesia ovis]|uniref:EF hand domain conatining, putative n=1 Tax=Babesia ovis TaxID=5869 RepID=A0A9W5TC74_BABOV|nr:EF hand domain conatining, putative [Babesia ovis]
MAEAFDQNQMAAWRKQLHDTCMKSLILSPAQDACLRKLFLKWDRRGYGSLDGDSARRLFRTAGLPDEILFDIWSVADINGTGELDYRAFCICCVLIAHAQMHPALLNHTDWMFDRELVDRIASGATMSEYMPYFDVSALDICERGNTPVMSTEEATRYEKLFQTLDRDGDGYLEGGDVREYYLMRNELQDDELVRIWEIADADADGRLTMKEFMVMEHLVQYSLSKATHSPKNGVVESARSDNGLTLQRAVREYDKLSSVGEASRDVVRSLPKVDVTKEVGCNTLASAMDGFTGKPRENSVKNTGPEPTIVEHEPTGTSETRDFKEPVGPKSSEAVMAESHKLKDHVESLKQYIEDLENELQKVKSENDNLVAMYNKSEERIEQLHSLYKIHTAEVETEQAYLRKEERELNELQDRIKALRREKLKHESDQQALRDALMHTEDAEQTMLRSVRSEQGKVASIRTERIQTMRTTIELLESLHPAINTTVQSSKPTMRAINDRNVVHDSKGIRVSTSESVMDRRLNPHMASHHHSDWSQKESEVYQG